MTDTKDKHGTPAKDEMWKDHIRDLAEPLFKQELRLLGYEDGELHDDTYKAWRIIFERGYIAGRRDE